MRTGNALDVFMSICSTRSDKLDVELALKNTKYSRLGTYAQAECIRYPLQ